MKFARSAELKELLGIVTQHLSFPLSDRLDSTRVASLSV